MLDYHRLGLLPPKHHIQHRSESGKLYQEHCLTRAGFEKAYSILYHEYPPTEEILTKVSHLDGSEFLPQAPPNGDLDFPRRRRHIDTLLVAKGTDYLSSRKAILFNEDITVSIAKPTENSTDFWSNGDADELLFFFEGSGWAETMFGEMAFGPNDYLLIPRACIHRLHFDFAKGPVFILVMEGHKDMEVPPYFRNEFGQLKMEAPYCHRDFRKPEKLSWIPGQDPKPGPHDDGLHKVVLKRRGRISEHYHRHYPLDIVGWDGYVYPVAFNIMDYQPKAGQVHLPPTSHTTWSSACGPQGQGTRYVVCSFVPRKVDFHPLAIPCPYNHSSPDCDEILFYVRGNFISRKGIHPGSISLHPTGIPHGPHPGAYEASIGHTETHELAVMMDTFVPLQLTNAGAEIEDKGYHETWLEGAPRIYKDSVAK